MAKRKDNKVSFDPSKPYSWEPDQSFSLNGREFSIAYNNLNEFLSTPLSPVTMLKVADVFSIIQKQLVSKVEAGDIKEKTMPAEQGG